MITMMLGRPSFLKKLIASIIMLLVKYHLLCFYFYFYFYFYFTGIIVISKILDLDVNHLIERPDTSEEFYISLMAIR